MEDCGAINSRFFAATFACTINIFSQLRDRQNLNKAAVHKFHTLGRCNVQFDPKIAAVLYISYVGLPKCVVSHCVHDATLGYNCGFGSRTHTSRVRFLTQTPSKPLRLCLDKLFTNGQAFGKWCLNCTAFSSQGHIFLFLHKIKIRTNSKNKFSTKLSETYS